MKTTQQTSKPYIGMGMEGFFARWYAKSTWHDLPDFRREADKIAKQLRPDADFLEVAPGPGYFSIELAKLGSFHITGLDISHTCVQIARENAREQAVSIDFRQGNASAMPFESSMFDFIFCRAAFKNFSQPIEAINEMHRVLRPGGRALIFDLRKDVSHEDIDAYFKNSGRSLFDSFLTKLAFSTFLVKRAYMREDFQKMAATSRFGQCRISIVSIGLEVCFEKAMAGRQNAMRD
jgi:ubiquinone/menaquinone biosynthesis C-methylase UbiE